MTSFYTISKEWQACFITYIGRNVGCNTYKIQLTSLHYTTLTKWQIDSFKLNPLDLVLTEMLSEVPSDLMLTLSSLQIFIWVFWWQIQWMQLSVGAFLSLDNDSFTAADSSFSKVHQSHISSYIFLFREKGEGRRSHLEILRLTQLSIKVLHFTPKEA